MDSLNRRALLGALFSSLGAERSFSLDRNIGIRGEPEAMAAEISQQGNVLFFSGFETGNLEDGSWTRAFGVQSRFNDRLTAGPGCSKLSKRSLCVNLKKGTYGPENGIVFNPYFHDMGLGREEEISLQYSLKFGSNMTGRAGGKLPGLASAGGFAAEGCRKIDGHEGWSARNIFGGTTVDGPIHLLAYPYVVNAEEISRPYRTNLRCGGFVPFVVDPHSRDKMHTYYEFQREKWYSICQVIRLNDVGQANGVLRVYVNQKIVVDHDDMIGRLFFEIFHGGNDASWAPERDESICFDDLIISRKPIWM
jgi:hypothetical protein